MNISIKWKILGAFLITALLPYCLWAGGAPSFVVFGLPPAVGVCLAAYTYYRIHHTLTEVELMVSEASSRPLVRDGTLHDELDGVLSKLECLSWQGEPESPGTDEPLARQDPVQAEHLSRLSTGEACSGTLLIVGARSDSLHVGRDDLSLDARLRLLRSAFEQVETRLKTLYDTLPAGSASADILEFQILSAGDPVLIEGVSDCLARGESVDDAIIDTFGVFVEKLSSAENEYFRARSADVIDLRLLVQEAYGSVSGDAEKQDDRYAQARGSVVLLSRVHPTDVLSLDGAGVLGVIAREGTPSSHTQILLQALNIPSLCGFEDDFPAHTGQAVLLDTAGKRLVLNPDEQALRILQGVPVSDADSEVIASRVSLSSGEPCRVSATVNVVSEVAHAAALGADGIGLFRTEIDYLSSATPPDEETLFEVYSKVVSEMGGKPVTFRMLDLGNDKVSFGSSTLNEENPAMGNRSMRMLIDNPDLLRTQLRALIRAAGVEDSIMFPLISGWKELDAISQHTGAVESELGVEKGTVRYGMMLEVPSVVFSFEDYVDEFDVFNIGTNDLIQYSLAVDRNNESVADYFSVLHPSVLKMLDHLCTVADKRGKSLCLCGEAAAHIEWLPLFVGLGLREYSVQPDRVFRVKDRLRGLCAESCEELARGALACRTADEVARFLETTLSSNALIES